jgi:hypothetical protein
MKLRIIFNDPDNGPVDVGTLEAPEGMSHLEAKVVVNKAWAAFQESDGYEPDSEAFENWLVSRHGFRLVDNEITTVVIGD